MTHADVLSRLESYYDAVPRRRANVEEVGPFTLFVALVVARFVMDGGMWFSSYHTRAPMLVRIKEEVFAYAQRLSSAYFENTLSGKIAHRTVLLPDQVLALFDMTVEYLQTRRQFGRPLAMFQALKHRCADLKTQIAAAEALFWRLADEGNRTAFDPLVEAGALKSQAAAAYSLVAEEAIQLHGGIGLTAEHPFFPRELIQDRNFTSAVVFFVFIAGVLF